MTTGVIRILLADDHKFFRDGVRTLLTSVHDFEVVGEAVNGEDAVSLSLEVKPDVILMDLQMPGLNGVEATRRIADVLPNTGIIVVTMFEDTDSVLAAMRAGARGYILKDADEDVLLRSIRSVAHGEALFSPSIARRLLTYLADVTPSASRLSFPELTEREREVLALIADGLNNQELADRLGCSLKTARNHVSNVLSKLHAVDRNEAIARARAAGLGSNRT